MGAFFLWTDPSGTTKTMSFDVVTTENPKFPNQITEHAVEQGPDVTDNVRVGCRTIMLEVFVTNEPIKLVNQWDNGSGDINTLQIPTPGAYGQPAFYGQQPVSYQNYFTLPIGVPIIGALAAHAQTDVAIANIGLPPTLGGNIAPKVLQFSSPFDAVQQTHDALELLRTTAQLITVYGTKGTYDNMVIEEFDLSRTADEGTGGTFTIQLKEIRIVTTTTTTAPVPTKARGQTQNSKGSQATAQAADAQFQSWLSWGKQLFSGMSLPGSQTSTQ